MSVVGRPGSGVPLGGAMGDIFLLYLPEKPVFMRLPACRARGRSE